MRYGTAYPFSFKTEATSHRERSKRPAPDTWVKNVRQTSRLFGKEYTSRGQKKVNPRIMGPACNSNYCKKSANRNCSSFTESERLKIFNKFWRMNSWDEKHTFVQSLAENVPKKQLKTGDASRRSVVYSYVLEKEGRREQVCKAMVANTLGIKERTLINWIIKKNEESKESVPVVARSGLSEPVGEEDRNFLIHWLITIPTVPSTTVGSKKPTKG
ncbi:E2F transcription factor 6 [Elysia marginata]|uniref:E2F transcription factor 6 n=1 Tax=Elysia marginata TaxID=1093978 RepID=A0AAV4FP35_9GAST|nr:E2F transcription factor 6 [Elysia marginata]